MDLLDLEEALSVASSLGLLQGLLAGQEGRGLGKEDGESAQTDVFHRVLGIVTFARVKQPAQDPAQLLDLASPSLEAHAANLRRTSARSGLR